MFFGSLDFFAAAFTLALVCFGCFGFFTDPLGLPLPEIIHTKNPRNVLSSKHKPFFSPLGCDALEGAMLVVVLSSSKSRLQSHLQPETFSPAPCLCEEGRAKMLWQHISVSWVEHPAPHSSVLKISEINHTNYDFRFKPSPTSSKHNWSHCFISNCDQVFPRTAVFAPNLYGGNL